MYNGRRSVNNYCYSYLKKVSWDYFLKVLVAWFLWLYPNQKDSTIVVVLCVYIPFLRWIQAATWVPHAKGPPKDPAT